MLVDKIFVIVKHNFPILFNSRICVCFGIFIFELLESEDHKWRGNFELRLTKSQDPEQKNEVSEHDPMNIYYETNRLNINIGVCIFQRKFLINSIIYIHEFLPRPSVLNLLHKYFIINSH